MLFNYYIKHNLVLHSCKTALVNRTHGLAIDNSKMIIVLFDFKKAFVDHQILLYKLKIYGIKDDAL